MKAFLTGGSAGLGKAICRQLLDTDWDVVTLDRGNTPVEGNSVHVKCDLADRKMVDQSIPAVIAAGPYDLAILNAGISATGNFEQIPVEAQQRVLRVNAEAPMILAAALVAGGALKDPSSLVFVSSLSHFTGYPGAAVYAASKDALAVYARSIRRPFAKKGVKVVSVFPGPMRTAHAARHAPPGADAARRMPAEKAARRIIAACHAGKRTVIPGTGPRLAALAGRLFPTMTTGRMRRLIYERLERAVW